jgi:MoxR-like ATPase
MILGGKMRALCAGREQVTAEDIRAVAVPALSHRLLLSFEGQAERIQPETIVQQILENVPLEKAA